MTLTFNPVRAIVTTNVHATLSIAFNDRVQTTNKRTDRRKRPTVVTFPLERSVKISLTNSGFIHRARVDNRRGDSEDRRQVYDVECSKPAS